MNIFSRLVAGAALLGAACLASAETADAAKALLDSAVQEVKADGLEAMAKELNAGGAWNKGSLYVVLVGFDGAMLAHSANPKMAGKNMIEARDAGGKAFVQEAISLAKGTGNGAIDIRWANPQTKQIADATMFVKRVPGKDAYVGSVVFK